MDGKVMHFFASHLGYDGDDVSIRLPEFLYGALWYRHLIAPN
ncbi:hypothetical protein D083_0940 [Dickeya solani RNS 08.23.3.1.A]|nr:hypothetical protein D083_0940 [Dickeya solani RNS 08.23.3.1.A]